MMSVFTMMRNEDYKPMFARARKVDSVFLEGVHYAQPAINVVPINLRNEQVPTVCTDNLSLPSWRLGDNGCVSRII